MSAVTKTITFAVFVTVPQYKRRKLAQSDLSSISPTHSPTAAWVLITTSHGIFITVKTLRNYVPSVSSGIYNR